MNKKYLKLILLFIFLTCGSLFSSELYSWDGDDHQIMTRHALQEVSVSWWLDKPVAVVPLSSFLKKLEALRPAFRDPWYFSNYLKINTTVDLDKYHTDTQGRATLTPFEILSSYATDPDEGRDEDLFVRDGQGNPQPMFPDQVWFGELQGANSKAFRHLEKPPFSFKHPITTFGFPFRRLGEATQRAEIYYQLSKLAFSLNENYWGWRFLASSFHYLQDLHQPYHAAQITPALASEAVHAYFDWGRKKDASFRGFIRTAAHLVSNSHRFYESYTARPGIQNEALRTRLLKALEGATLLDTPPSSIENLALQIRDTSNLVWADLERDIHHIMNEQLKGPYSLVTETQPRDNPDQFLVKGPDFEETNQKIFQISEARFLSAGKVMRSVVDKILHEKKEDGLKILEELDALLLSDSR